jgi:hypothetical protein
MEEATNHLGCDFCKQVSEEEYLHLETPGEIFNLCSWHCVIGFAAAKAHHAEAYLLGRLRQVEERLEESERRLTLHLAGAL